MASDLVLVGNVVLRFLILGALFAAIIVLATNQYHSVLDGSKTSSKDFITYRYVIVTAGLGCLYTLIQLPFSIYHAYKKKRLIQNNFLPNLDYYGDQLFTLVLGTGASAGFLVSAELKKLVKESYDVYRGIIAGIDEEGSKENKFLDRGYVASGLLLLGFVCMVILSAISSYNKTRKSGLFG